MSQKKVNLKTLKEVRHHKPLISASLAIALGVSVASGNAPITQDETISSDSTISAGINNTAGDSTAGLLLR